MLKLPRCLMLFSFNLVSYIYDLPSFFQYSFATHTYFTTKIQIHIDAKLSNLSQTTKTNIVNGSSSSSHSQHHSPPSSSSDQPLSKKHSFDADNLTRNGFSAITLPFSLRGNVLHRCVSKSNPCTLPEQSSPARRSAGLPPLPPIRRCISEVIDPYEVKEAVSRYLNPAEKTTPESDSMVCWIVDLCFLVKK